MRAREYEESKEKEKQKGQEDMHDGSYAKSRAGQPGKLHPWIWLQDKLRWIDKGSEIIDPQL